MTADGDAALAYLGGDTVREIYMLDSGKSIGDWTDVRGYVRDMAGDDIRWALSQ